MDALVGAQYAVFVAMQTLKSRCSLLQQRVVSLEEENVNLRLQGLKTEPMDTFCQNPYDQLRAKVTELTEQKEHLQHKIRMIKSENEEVWSRLKQLSSVNQDLGEKLSKLSMSINEYAAKKSPLIRSKTFTQDEPQTKVLQRKREIEAEQQNEKTCAELEEISLKILTQTKHEMDSFMLEMNGENHCIDNIISDSCGFYYDDFDNDIIDEFNGLVEELKSTRIIAEKQKIALDYALQKINKLQEKKKNNACDKSISAKREMIDKETETLDEKIATPVSPRKSIPKEYENSRFKEENCAEVDKYCPVCSQYFSDAVSFPEFTQHVENHFRDEEYELL